MQTVSERQRRIVQRYISDIWYTQSSTELNELVNQALAIINDFAHCTEKDKRIYTGKVTYEAHLVALNYLHNSELAWHYYDMQKRF